MKCHISALVVALCVVASAYAQTFRGAINGTVKDATGAVVPNANVQATETSTAVNRNTIATSSGEFSLQDLPPGPYKVTVTAPGFAAFTAENVLVTAGVIFTLRVPLSVSQQSASVLVSAAALTVDTTTAAQTNTIAEQAVQNIPLNGRDFSQLIAIAPGYGGYSINGGGTVNGSRPNEVNWQIDGTDNNDFWYNLPAINQGGVAGVAGVVMPIDASMSFRNRHNRMRRRAEMRPVRSTSL